MKLIQLIKDKINAYADYLIVKYELIDDGKN